MSAVRIEETETLDPDVRAFADAAWERFDLETWGHTFERKRLVLTAQLDGRLIGVAIGWTGMGVAFLSELIVDASVRGRGTGSALLAAFEERAKSRGCPRMALRTEEGGPARRFYESHGWRVEARFEDWFDGSTFVQMRKDA